MSEVPAGLYYTEEHEYLRPMDEDGVFVIGITDYAQGELGDVVFLELPTVGDTFEAGESLGTIEAVKAVSDIYCPIAGEVVEVNTALADDPALVNSDPYGDGWMVRLKAADPADVESLLDHGGYRTLVGK